jgi:hypothetical protein
LEGPDFEFAILALLGREARAQCVLIAHQDPCVTGEVQGAQPFDGCEACGELVLLTPSSWQLTEDEGTRVLCVECAWAATEAVAARRVGLVC